MGAASILPAIKAIGTVIGAVSALKGTKQQKALPPPKAIKPAQEAPFSPTRPDEATRPESLNELSAFSPLQQRTALATQGVNSGLGSEEDSYYRNLIQRQLIGEGNQVDVGNENFLQPIESQFFSRQGVDTSNVMDFLKGIR